jgi:hypothetical protein
LISFRTLSPFGIPCSRHRETRLNSPWRRRGYLLPLPRVVPSRRSLFLGRSPLIPKTI